MNVYPITFSDPTGKILPAGETINGELVTDMSLPTQFWPITLAVDGNGYSGFPSGNFPITPPPSIAPPSIASIPNVSSGASPITVNMPQYVSGVYTSLEIDDLPVGWTFDGTTLTGTAPAASGSIELLANSSNPQVASNVFTLPAVTPALAADSYSPNTPYMPAVTLNSSNQPVITWLASADPSQPGQQWAGMGSPGGYPVTRGGSALTTVASNGGTANVRAAMTGADIGSPTNAGSSTQTGTQNVLTSGGIDWTGTADQGQFYSFELTGDFTVGCTLAAFSGSTQPFAKAGIGIRNTNDPGSPNVALFGCPNNSNTQFTGRATQGGATTAYATTAAYKTSERFVVTRVGNVFTAYQSPDGLTYTQMAQQTLALNTTVSVGFFACSHDATGASVVSVTLKDCFLSQDTAYSYTDTSISLTGSPQNFSYAVNAKDASGNASTGGLTLNVTVPASGGAGVSLVQKLANYLATLGSNKAGLLVGQHSNVFPQSNSESPMDGFVGSNPNYTITTTGLCPAMLGTNVQGPANGSITQQTQTGVAGYNGVTSFVQASANWLNAGRILQVSAFFNNPAVPGSLDGGTDCTHNPFPGILQSGSTIYNTFVATLAGVATSLKALNTATGGKPFIFRILHECTIPGSWWWAFGSGGLCTTAQFQQLYKFIRNYFTSQGITNMLYTYNVNTGAGSAGTGGYPDTPGAAYVLGTSYVDIIGVDSYPPSAGDSATWNPLVAAAPGRPLIYGEAGVHTYIWQNVAENAYNNYTNLMQIVATSLPAVAGVMISPQTWGLEVQNGATQAMSTAPIKNAAQLPATLYS